MYDEIFQVTETLTETKLLLDLRFLQMAFPAHEL